VTASAVEEVFFEEFRGKRIAAVLHRAGPGPRPIVVMAHGFKSSKIGPSRYFVALARELASAGVSTFRFDQPGSGDSEGLFDDSSFAEWIDAIEHFARRCGDDGSRVAVLGQSMGGAAAMMAATRLGDAIRALAVWSAAPMLDAPADDGPDAWVEEEGQRVRAEFWREAASIDFLGAYRELAVPVRFVFGTDDDFIPPASVRAVEAARKPGDVVRVFEGLPHSAWPEPHRTQILRETREFLIGALNAGR
jgi:pimeloyl-ACP methyl ester carboxylesterase